MTKSVSSSSSYPSYPPLKLSVLDIGPIRSNQSASDAFAAMIALAQAAEQAGFTRYWLAEHHNVTADIAGNTPVVSGVLAAKTSRISTGGYIMLPHYTPFLIAEQMASLEACFPGRIDVCIGGATGADGITTAILRGKHRQHLREPDYVKSVQELLALLQPAGISVQAQGQSYPVKVLPRATAAPATWLLGGSAGEALLAARLGLPFSYPYHVTGEGGVEETIALYKSRFQPSAACPEPRVLASAITIVAKTTQEAWRLALAHLYILAAFRSGELVETQRLAEELDDLVIPQKYHQMIEMFKKTWIVGTPQEAAAQVRQLAKRIGVSEIMLVPVAAAYAADDPRRAPNREFTLTALAEALSL